MSSTPISRRLQAIFLGAFVLSCAAYLTYRFWPKDYVQELLGQMPAQAAVLTYVDVPGLTAAATDASLDLPWSLGLAANRLDGIALAMAGHELYVAVGGDFSANLVDALLSSQGVHCAASLAVAPCSADFGNGPLHLGMAGHRVLLAATASTLNFPRATDFHGDAAREALADGALLWTAIDPQLLDAAMTAPPPGWINLRLIARALEPSSTAYLTVRPIDGEHILVEVEALCDYSDREELEQVLGGLNDMALALLARDEVASGQWESTLRSFRTFQGAGWVRVEWTAPTARIAELLRAAMGLVGQR